MKKSKKGFVFHSLLTKEMFIDYIKSKGMILDFIPQTYGQMVRKKCRVFSMWAANQLVKYDFRFLKDILIHYGTVYGQMHTWIEVDGYYIDGTLAQFDSRYEGIYISEKESAVDFVGTEVLFRMGEQTNIGVKGKYKCIQNKKRNKFLEKLMLNLKRKYPSQVIHLD